MVWLNALLAFSLAMIVFCTIVSAMTEALQRIFHMRPAGLRRMVEQLFDEYIWPRLGHTLAAASSGNAAAAAKKAFLDVVTRNPAVEPSGPMRIIGRWLAPRQLDSLTVMQFIERTAETDIGAAIRQAGAAGTAEIIDELARRFSRLGEGASLYFAQRAKMISVLLAVALAFAMNVDAIRLLSAFMTDQQLAQQIIAQADAIKTAYAAQVRRTDEAADSDAEAVAADVKASLENVQRQVKALENADQTAAFGLPVGSRYFPLCVAPNASAGDAGPEEQDSAATTDSSCARLRSEGEMTVPEAAGCLFQRSKDNGLAQWLRDRITYIAFTTPASAGAQSEIPGSPPETSSQGPTGPSCWPKTSWYRFQLLAWFASVALSGLLIGLGGPFWFDAFAKLSSAVQILRGLGLGKTEEAKQADAAASAASVAPTPPPTAAEAFMKASGSAAPKATRLLLGPTGAPRLGGNGRT